MARRTGGKSLAAPAQKYAGQVKVEGGPVPLENWRRPLTRAEHDKTPGPEGTDLHPERRPYRSGRVPETPSGQQYNRQSK
jgi:hypothetical protein